MLGFCAPSLLSKVKFFQDSRGVLVGDHIGFPQSFGAHEPRPLEVAEPGQPSQLVVLHQSRHQPGAGGRASVVSATLRE